MQHKVYFKEGSSVPQIVNSGLYVQAFFFTFAKPNLIFGVWGIELSFTQLLIVEILICLLGVIVSCMCCKHSWWDPLHWASIGVVTFGLFFMGWWLLPIWQLAYASCQATLVWQWMLLLPSLQHNTINGMGLGQWIKFCIAFLPVSKELVEIGVSLSRVMGGWSVCLSGGCYILAWMVPLWLQMHGAGIAAYDGVE